MVSHTRCRRDGSFYPFVTFLPGPLALLCFYVGLDSELGPFREACSATSQRMQAEKFSTTSVPHMTIAGKSCDDTAQPTQPPGETPLSGPASKSCCGCQATGGWHLDEKMLSQKLAVLAAQGLAMWRGKGHTLSLVTTTIGTLFEGYECAETRLCLAGLMIELMESRRYWSRECWKAIG
jgi:hypothetical protein